MDKRYEKELYQGLFSDWEDVVEQFSGIHHNETELQAKIKEVGKPTEVLFANYDGDGYEGSAFVLWRKGRKYYTLHGSHCSCYGLEEAGWDPSDWTKKELIAYLEKGGYISYAFPDADRIRIVRKLKRKKSVQTRNRNSPAPALKADRS